MRPKVKKHSHGVVLEYFEKHPSGSSVKRLETERVRVSTGHWTSISVLDGQLQFKLLPQKGLNWTDEKWVLAYVAELLAEHVDVLLEVITELCEVATERGRQKGQRELQRSMRRLLGIEEETSPYYLGLAAQAQ